MVHDDKLPQDPADQWRWVGSRLDDALDTIGELLSSDVNVPGTRDLISAEEYRVLHGIRAAVDEQADRLTAARGELAGAGVKTTGDVVADDEGNVLARRGFRDRTGSVQYDPALMQGVLEDGRQAIGWPHAGYVAPNRPRESMNRLSTYGGYYLDERTGKLVKSETKPQGPRYGVGDEYSLEGKPPAWIARMQKNLVLAGVLDGRAYRAGQWDDNTRSAYAEVLGYANRQGRTWEEALPEMIAVAQDPATKEARRLALRSQATAFTPDAYEAPDAATLAQAAKSALTRRLGRTLSRAELADVAAVLSAEDRAAYAQNVDVSQEMHGRQIDAQIAAALGETVERIDPSQEFRDVDPSARVAEYIDRHYSGEVATRQRSEQVSRQGASLSAGMDRMRAQLMEVG